MLLENMPMSPTSNHAFKIGRNGRHYPSKAMLLFQTEFSKWVLENEYKLGILKTYLVHELAKAPKPDFDLNILYGKIRFDRKFYFRKETLFYKNGNRRRLDVTNRVKYLDDYLCKSLGIDDMHIIGSEDYFLDAQDHVSVNINVIN